MITDYYKQQMLKHAFAKTNYTATDTYLALFSSINTNSPHSSGTPGVVECNYTGYTRQSGTGVWASSPTDSFISCPPVNVDFGAVSSGVTVDGVGLYNNQTIGAGNLLFYYKFLTPTALISGDNPRIGLYRINIHMIGE